MQEGAPGDELFERFNAKVYRSQIVCLLAGTWLNDEIINQFLFLLQERSAQLCEDFALGQRGQGARLRCYMHNTQFYEKVTEGGVYNYSRVEKWTTRGTRKADLFVFVFDKDIVFFPRNISGTHWALCVAYIMELRIEYLDSMGADGAQCMAYVLRYLADEHAKKKKSTLDTSTWTTKSHLRSCPQQLNMNDCGVFLCTFVNHLSVGAQLIFSQSDMEFYRKRITISLLNGKADIHYLEVCSHLPFATLITCPNRGHDSGGSDMILIRFS
jgi:sentrin-specific protease 1